MGMGRWSPADWDVYAKAAAGKAARDIFSGKLQDDMDPKKILLRESCDSDLNPLSTPIIVAVDNTGSMGILAETLIRHGLGVLIEEIYDRKPVPDPHVMCMAVGDAWCDVAPLQTTQFETDLRLANQLSRFWIEGGGGGNKYESYNLPWYFASTRTKCDSLLKRNKKGYLFTVGDEPPSPVLMAEHVNKILGDELRDDILTRDVLTMASKQWEVFHIMIEQGSYYRSNPDDVKQSWRKLLGQRAIGLSDHEKLAELIVSTIEVMEGADALSVAGSWGGSTAVVVQKALTALGKTTSTIQRGLFRF